MVLDALIGYGCCLLSAISFGSMFAPLQSFETKDGFFVQWVQSGVIFCVGVVVLIWKNFPKIYPIAVLSGVFFATGNVTAIPIVNQIGMGLGILLWGSIQVLSGWSVGRFGLFGLNPQVPHSDVLQIIGLILTLGSAFMFAFVRYTKDDETTSKVSTEKAVDVETISKKLHDQLVDDGNIKNDTVAETSWLMANKAKIFCVCLAMFAGLLYGQLLTPMQYILDNYPDEPKDGLVYVFSMAVGIWSFSTLYFFFYCLYKRNAPFVNAGTVLPSMAYGFMWAVAMFAWFVSTQKLSQAISIPISTRLPGVVASMWDVFYFKKIKGRRNLLLLAAAVTVAVIGVVLVGLSAEEL